MDAGENAEKLPRGPTASRPGPMLLMQAVRAVKVVTSPFCSRDNSKKETTNTAIYTVK